MPFSCRSRRWPRQRRGTGIWCGGRPGGATLPADAAEALALGRLVLVAEDNETNQDIIRRQLARYGIMAELAADGRQALEAWRARRHPLVLTDCYMPEMDGFQLARAIRDDGSDCPILAVTASVGAEDIEACRNAGMNDWLTGEEIPLSARLMAVADVYDALISRRVYKDGMPHDAAVAIIIEGKGRHFDPDIVDAFLGIQDEFRAIALDHADSDDDLNRKRELLSVSGTEPNPSQKASQE